MKTAGNSLAGLTGWQSRPRLGAGVRGTHDDAQPAALFPTPWSTVPLQSPCELVLRAGQKLFVRTERRASAGAAAGRDALGAGAGTDLPVARPRRRAVMVANATGADMARFYTTIGTLREHATSPWHRSTLSAKETRSQMVAPKADTLVVRSRQPGHSTGRAWSVAHDGRLSRRPVPVDETAALSSVPQRGVAGLRQGAVFCQDRPGGRPRSCALVRCGHPARPGRSRHFWDLKHER